MNGKNFKINNENAENICLNFALSFKIIDYFVIGFDNETITKKFFNNKKI